ncbi:MAG: site-specific recombinase, partial [Alphaproteobacteria bacterium]
MRMRVKGLNCVVSRGKLYCYHRKSGKRIKAAFGTAQFALEVATIEAEYAGKQAVKALPGTLGLLIDAYRQSPAWGILKPKTRVSYDRAFAAVEGLRDSPLALFKSPFIAKLRDKLHGTRGRWMANYVVTVLGVVLGFGLEQGHVEENGATKVKKIRRETGAETANRP